MRQDCLFDLFVLSFNTSIQDEPYIVIKPAFVNAVLAGVQVVTGMEVLLVSHNPITEQSV